MNQINESSLKQPIKIGFGTPIVLIFLLFIGCLSACSETEIPQIENEEELITDIRLVFTPVVGGSPVEVLASDPDGEGPQDLSPASAIVLSANTAYTLSMDIENAIAGTSLTEEIREEAAEHLFFFGWTEGLFGEPLGNGNIDERSDPVGYDDEDLDGLPLGLQTSWLTSQAGAGTFRVVLKHQPGTKSANSTVNDGESDIDVTWDIQVE